MGQESSHAQTNVTVDRLRAITQRFEKLGCEVDILARNCEEHFQIAAAFVDMYTKTCAGELDLQSYRERLGNDSLVAELARLSSDVWQLSREMEDSTPSYALVLYAPTRDARATGDNNIQVVAGNGDDVFGLFWPGLMKKQLSHASAVNQVCYSAARVIAYTKDSGALPLALVQNVHDCPVTASDLHASDATAYVIDHWNAFMTLPYSDTEYRVKNKRHTLVFDSGFVQRLLQCSNMEVTRIALQNEFQSYEGFYFDHIVYLAFPVLITPGQWRLIIADLRREALSITCTSSDNATSHIAVVRIIVQHFLTHIAEPETRGRDVESWNLTGITLSSAAATQSGTILIDNLTAFVASMPDGAAFKNIDSGQRLQFVKSVVSKTGGIRFDATGQQAQTNSASSPLGAGAGLSQPARALPRGSWTEFQLESASGAHIKRRPTVQARLANAAKQSAPAPGSRQPAPAPAPGQYILDLHKLL